LLREPLAQFLAVAAVLFAAHTALAGPSPADDVIVVGEGRINQLVESFRLVSGRPPSPPELAALVDDFVAEEIAYREAVALGLDADDTVVRRRMRQKLEFLLEDMGAIEEPADDELEALLAADPARYAEPERRTVEQALASGDRRGEGARAHAGQLLDQLRGGAEARGVGDPSLLPVRAPLMTRDALATLFGREFAAAAFAAPAGDWFGPVASPFGAHAVRVSEIVPGRPATVAGVRDRLRADWIDARRHERRAAEERRMRERYDVRIAWPGGAAPAAPEAVDAP
jgi:hypothetical protein